MPSPAGKDDLLAFTSSVGPQLAAVIAVDVVAHEFTHLVTAYNSGLVYREQPGAINEALSDIFGAHVERAVEGPGPNNFLVAEASGPPQRDMRHPRAATACVGRPDNYRNVRVIAPGGKPADDNDRGFVHANSSIVNNAWALTVEGGTNDTSGLSVEGGLGWQKTLKLRWKSQQHLITRRMGIQRLARVQSMAAKKSKGRYDVDVVACAWAAVDGITVDFARKKLKAKCGEKQTLKGAALDYCKGKADGTYCHELDKFLGYICKGGAVQKGLQCPPPNTVCTGPSADGQSLVCSL